MAPLKVIVSFPLFGVNGIVNPGVTQGRRAHWLYIDPNGGLRPRQTAKFDGGWRWFRSSCNPARAAPEIVIYNVLLHPRAYAAIADSEFEDSILDAEIVLVCAQARVTIDHSAFNATEFVLEHLRQFAETH